MTTKCVAIKVQHSVSFMKYSFTDAQFTLNKFVAHKNWFS